MPKTINDDARWADTQLARELPIRVPDNDAAWIVWQLRWPGSDWPDAPRWLVAQTLQFEYLEEHFPDINEDGMIERATDQDWAAAEVRAYETIADGLADGSIFSPRAGCLDVPHTVRVNLDAVRCWVHLVDSRVNPNQLRRDVPDRALEHAIAGAPEPLQRLVDELARSMPRTRNLRGYSHPNRVQAARAVLGNTDSHRWAARLLRLLHEIDPVGHPDHSGGPLPEFSGEDEF